MKIAFTINQPEQLNIDKDTSLGLLFAAYKLGYTCFIVEPQNLSIQNNKTYGQFREVTFSGPVISEPIMGNPQYKPCAEIHAFFARHDPPFDQNYLYSTYLLDCIKAEGVRVFNDPTAIRACNEKLFSLQFPQWIPPHCVSSNSAEINNFIHTFKEVILKPLNGMGGQSIFRVQKHDPNISVIIETLTQYGRTPIMAQQFIPEVRAGDKRILIVQGSIVPYCLARIPAHNETRGNLAAGGRGVAQPLSERDYAIAENIAPTLQEMGLVFVGLDVIGDYLTEINVTSPTCMREIERDCKLDIAISFIKQTLQPL